MIKLELLSSEITEAIRDWVRKHHPEFTKDRVSEVSLLPASVTVVVTLKPQPPNLSGYKD